jgi:hypothetical protein
MSVESTFHDAVKSAVSELRSIANGLSGKPDAGIGWTSEAIVHNVGLITAQANKLTDALSVAEALTEIPKIDSISPTSGPAGTVFTITGSGFGDSPEGAVVKVAGVIAHPNSWSPNKITATVPNGVAKGDVSVTTSAGVNSGTKFVFESDYVPPVAPTDKPDLEPLITAEPGTPEFVAQTEQHDAWVKRQPVPVTAA